MASSRVLHDAVQGRSSATPIPPSASATIAMLRTQQCSSSPSISADVLRLRRAAVELIHRLQKIQDGQRISNRLRIQDDDEREVIRFLHLRATGPIHRALTKLLSSYEANSKRSSTSRLRYPRIGTLRDVGLLKGLLVQYAQVIPPPGSSEQQVPMQSPSISPTGRAGPVSGAGEVDAIPALEMPVTSHGQGSPSESHESPMMYLSMDSTMLQQYHINSGIGGGGGTDLARVHGNGSSHGGHPQLHLLEQHQRLQMLEGNGAASLAQAVSKLDRAQPRQKSAGVPEFLPSDVSYSPHAGQEGDEFVVHCTVDAGASVKVVWRFASAFTDSLSREYIAVLHQAGSDDEATSSRSSEHHSSGLWRYVMRVPPRGETSTAVVMVPRYDSIGVEFQYAQRPSLQHAPQLFQLDGVDDTTLPSDDTVLLQMITPSIGSGVLAPHLSMVSAETREVCEAHATASGLSALSSDSPALLLAHLAVTMADGHLYATPVQFQAIVLDLIDLLGLSVPAWMPERVLTLAQLQRRVDSKDRIDVMLAMATYVVHIQKRHRFVALITALHDLAQRFPAAFRSSTWTDKPMTEYTPALALRVQVTLSSCVAQAVEQDPHWPSTLLAGMRHQVVTQQLNAQFHQHVLSIACAAPIVWIQAWNTRAAGVFNTHHVAAVALATLSSPGTKYRGVAPKPEQLLLAPLPSHATSGPAELLRLLLALRGRPVRGSLSVIASRVSGSQFGPHARVAVLSEHATSVTWLPWQVNDGPLQLPALQDIERSTSMLIVVVPANAAASDFSNLECVPVAAEAPGHLAAVFPRK